MFVALLEILNDMFNGSNEYARAKRRDKKRVKELKKYNPEIMNIYKDNPDRFRHDHKIQQLLYRDMNDQEAVDVFVEFLKERLKKD